MNELTTHLRSTNGSVSGNSFSRCTSSKKASRGILEDARNNYAPYISWHLENEAQSSFFSFIMNEDL